MNQEDNSSHWQPNPGHKVPPLDAYPPEEGRCVRGNDLSPVAVCVILKWPEDEIPDSIERLVRVGVESGAALAGTLQTENIGIEKMICNLVANPNIRYLIVCGPESPGHSVGQTLKALASNGLDDDSRIAGSEAQTPYIYNIPRAAVDRFREQIRIVDLIDVGDPALVRKAVWSCYQEQPTEFLGAKLFDPGAFPGEAICASVTWRVRQPWYAPRDPGEATAAERMQKLMAQIKAKADARRTHSRGGDKEDSKAHD